LAFILNPKKDGSLCLKNIHWKHVMNHLFTTALARSLQEPLLHLADITGDLACCWHLPSLFPQGIASKKLSAAIDDFF
jgi:hypothetical protein